ncbi:hypothetical protein [Pseudorhodoplanes sinuspersici]|uniref:Uncharacterized protein n=1 Tax=Pseudorhodoplanes sinuspersici TaxID=1235591 RepID=A0A1W6ZLD9_9HYPH|nr:hypothetical protein [Pseudorhodoplanes sinuspersici]ARP98243.1 hypothetical protein CAK95_03415 [Pseudorhodoplanes sinuspersici]RKE68000.1 hypothetical protein DFP91_4354 [Pseudorhodoplanes sinuspersici]
MTEDNANSSAVNGWTLQKSLERTAAPHLWKQWTLTRSAYDDLCKRLSSGTEVHSEQFEGKRKIAQIAAQSAFEAVTLSVWKLVKDERLFPYSSKDGVSAPTTPIVPLVWDSLQIKDLEKSCLVERAYPSNVHYNVRLFPFVHDKCTPQRIAGLTLAEAFRKCVLEDPEVVACGERVTSAGTDRAVFQEGQYPGPFVDFKWPLDQSAEDLGFEFVRQIVFWAGEPSPKPTVSMVAAANALADRWAALRRLLSSGSIIAHGTFSSTGVEQPISPRQWSRSSMSFDVKNSDLFEGASRNVEPRWTGIFLTLPEGAFHVLASQPAPSASRTGLRITLKKPGENSRHRPKSEQVTEAALARGIDICSEHLTPRAIANEIAPHLPTPHSTADQMDALTKLIRRLRTVRSNT